MVRVSVALFARFPMFQVNPSYSAAVVVLLLMIRKYWVFNGSATMTLVALEGPAL